MVGEHRVFISYGHVLWPERPDVSRLGGRPAQRAFAELSTSISRFEPVTMGVNRSRSSAVSSQERELAVLPGHEVILTGGCFRCITEQKPPGAAR